MKYQNQDRIHTAVLLLCQMLDSIDPLDEQPKERVIEENQKLVSRAVTLADLLLQRLEESTSPYQINAPKYHKKEKVILNCPDRQSLQTVREVYFDHSQNEWIYKFEPSSLVVHEFYSESFLSKILD